MNYKSDLHYREVRLQKYLVSGETIRQTCRGDDVGELKWTPSL